jgi:hypothetical protein
MNIHEQIAEKRSIEIERLNTLERLAHNIPTTLLENPTRIGSFSEYIGIALPYDLQALRQARKTLGQEWKQVQAWGNADCDSPYQAFAYRNKKYENVEFHITMRMNLPGSSCNRIQTGEKTVPVYEVICQ